MKMRKRKICVVTSTRAEYGILRWLMDEIRRDPRLTLQVVATGAHLAAAFGHTYREIEKDGFTIDETVRMPLGGHSKGALARAMGACAIGMSRAFERLKPDLILVLGDRYELLPVCSTAVVMNIPIAHISGGDVTEGAIDNQVRHAVSKMSHVHFVAMPGHARRLEQMGEESWRIHVTGDPALDLLGQIELLDRDALAVELGVSLRSPVLLVTHHPTTLGAGIDELGELLKALDGFAGTTIFTAPNADAGNRAMIERIENFVGAHPAAALFRNLGQRRFYSLMKVADGMVGNSSSGIWEAPSFRLPVVNIGERQSGRMRAANAVDSPAEAGSIGAAIRRVLMPEFRASLDALVNPYGDGQAVPRILSVLRKLDLGPRLLQKRFVDAPSK